MRAFSVGLVTAIALSGCGEPEPGPAVPAPAAVPSDRPAPVTSTAPGSPLAPFGTLELARAELTPGAPVRVHLALAEPSADANPLPAALLSMSDKRVLTTEAQLDEQRLVATIEIDAAWLRPDQYLVQLQTTERSPLPLRRYVLVVR
jgi:hypothetical protein